MHVWCREDQGDQINWVFHIHPDFYSDFAQNSGHYFGYFGFFSSWRVRNAYMMKERAGWPDKLNILHSSRFLSRFCPKFWTLFWVWDVSSWRFLGNFSRGRDTIPLLHEELEAQFNKNYQIQVFSKLYYINTLILWPRTIRIGKEPECGVKLTKLPHKWPQRQFTWEKCVKSGRSEREERGFCNNAFINHFCCLELIGQNFYTGTQKRLLLMR